MSGAAAGPYLAATGLLAIAGAGKAWRPDSATRALVVAGLGVPRWLVRIGGAAEAALGLSAFVIGGPVLAAAVSISYLAFGGYVVSALVRHTPLGSCGCFGQVDTPPTLAHVVINLAAAAVAAGVAVGPKVTISDALRGQPLFGGPFLLTVGLVCFLAFVALTASARLLAIRHDRGEVGV